MAAKKKSEHKLDINVVMAALDMRSKESWDEMNDDERKSIPLYTLNRWMSSAGSSRAEQEHFVLATNYVYNKNLFDIMSKHPKLAWQLLCICGIKDKRPRKHQWIKLEKEKSAKEKWLAEQFPHLKNSDIELLAAINTNEELKHFARDNGYSKSQLSSLKF